MKRLTLNIHFASFLVSLLMATLLVIRQYKTILQRMGNNRHILRIRSWVIEFIERVCYAMIWLSASHLTAGAGQTSHFSWVRLIQPLSLTALGSITIFDPLYCEPLSALLNRAICPEPNLNDETVSMYNQTLAYVGNCYHSCRILRQDTSWYAGSFTRVHSAMEWP